MSKIRLTESQLHRVIKESVKRVLSEMTAFDEKLEQMLRTGQLPQGWTDEMALDMLKKHKKRDMDYDFEQEKEKMNNMQVPSSYSNNNVRDSNSPFSERSAYIKYGK